VIEINCYVIPDLLSLLRHDLSRGHPEDSIILLPGFPGQAGE